MRRLGPVLAAAVTLAVLCSCPGGRERQDELMRLVPRLAPEMATHLTHDDEEAFHRYGRAAGTMALRDALGPMDGARDVRSRDGYSRTTRTLLPYQRRVARVLADEFGCTEYLEDLELRSRLPIERTLAIDRALFEADTIASDPNLDPRIKVARREDLIARLRALGYPRGVMMLEGGIAAEVMKLGNAPERVARLRRALALARSLNHHAMLCQFLGEMGAAYSSLGRADSMLICYEEARRIALQCRLPDQLARILLFYSRHYADEGRLALATDLVLESQKVCREMGGGRTEIRFVAGAMNHFAELGCWEIVERLLARCPALLREAPGPDRRGNDPMRLEVELLRVRVLLAAGRVTEAMTRYREIRTPFLHAASRVSYAHLLEHVTAGLVAARRHDLALPMLEEAVAYCDSLYVGEKVGPLEVRLGQTCLALGRFDRAAWALEDFDRRLQSGADEAEPVRIARDVLDARLRERRGDPAGARRVLAGAMEKLRDHARRLDAGAQSYLALGSFEDLRLAMHEIVIGDPVEGYRFELAWRTLAADLGRGDARGHGVEAPMTRGALPPRGTLHCLYWAAPGGIVRWTATSSGVHRDTIPIQVADLTARIEHVLERLERGPGVGDRGRDPELTELARLLLPAEALAENGHTRILVTPDGPLRLLPFEALDLGGADYVPLASRFDVAYAGSLTEPRVRDAVGPASILMDPATTPEVRRRYLVAGALEQARTEAELAQRAWPTARLLGGAEATKSAVLTAWRQAPRIYVAAHLVRDPEIPFLTFLPAACPPGRETRADGYIEFADVRRLDLRGCELVVLSACASGQPYLAAGRRLGPSMADAFLDAGAGAVIQTFWPIRDDEALPFMESFLREWGGNGGDPVRALNRVRREAIRRSADPRSWAAWSVIVRGRPAAMPPVARARSGGGRERHGAMGQAASR